MRAVTTETEPALSEPTASCRIALVGDYDPAVAAHRAIPRALIAAAECGRAALGFEWVDSDAVGDAERTLARFDGLWCVPGSPYRSLAGVLAAIGFARRHQRPFLGSCGGFQHAVLEHARTDLGWADAEHAETAPEARRPVIAPLDCGLVETERTVRFAPGSLIARAYGRESSVETYRCRYGVVPALREALFGGHLRAVGFVAGEDDGSLPAVHAVERSDHPFFVATLFQSERAALQGQPVPLAEAFVRACLARRTRHEPALEAD